MESPPLPASREWFQTTLASIGDAVIATDRQGRVVFLNPVAAELTGWPEAEALGQDSTAVFRIVNEVTRQAVEHPITRVLREGTVVGLANQTLLLGRDGVERPIDDSGAPIYDAQGQLLGGVLVFRDITERRRAEAARTHLAAIVDPRAHLYRNLRFGNNALFSNGLNGGKRECQNNPRFSYGSLRRLFGVKNRPKNSSNRH